MDLIVAVDEKWGIGKDGQLLVRISGDMKRFRQMTVGNVVIMGRKTIDTFPNQKPLPERKNIILTHNTQYICPEAEVCHSIQEVLKKVEKERKKQIFVIGGGSIYQQFLPYCERAYVTKIYQTFVADTYFKNLDEDYHWKLIEQEKLQEENGISYGFFVYENQYYQQNAVKLKIV